MGINTIGNDGEFIKEKVNLQNFLEGRLTRLEDTQTKSELQGLIYELKTAQSREELKNIENKLEQLKDAEIINFLKELQRAALKDLKKDVMRQPDVNAMDEQSLRELADKGRMNSSNVVHSDLRHLSNSSGKGSLLSWLIEKAE